MKIYVASSWRNEDHKNIVGGIRAFCGHEVYDFKNPRPGCNGFHWSEIDPDWQSWKPAQFRTALQDDIASKGFSSDWEAMQWADVCVLLLPCGRSAHLEAGWFVGQGKKVIVHAPNEMPNFEPELMYLMTQGITTTDKELLDMLGTA